MKINSVSQTLLVTFCKLSTQFVEALEGEREIGYGSCPQGAHN
jgi:hypothetical protein